MAMPTSERIQCAGMEMLACGCVYSKATLGGSKECWYCRQISDGKGTNCSWDYKVHRGFLYNPDTGKIRVRRDNEQKGRYSL